MLVRKPPQHQARLVGDLRRGWRLGLRRLWGAVEGDTQVHHGGGGEVDVRPLRTGVRRSTELHELFLGSRSAFVSLWLRSNYCLFVVQAKM